MIKDDFLTLTAQKFINTYFTSRNFDQVKNMFAPEGSWLGASNNTMANNLKQFDHCLHPLTFSLIVTLIISNVNKKISNKKRIVVYSATILLIFETFSTTF